MALIKIIRKGVIHNAHGCNNQRLVSLVVIFYLLTHEMISFSSTSRLPIETVQQLIFAFKFAKRSVQLCQQAVPFFDIFDSQSTSQRHAANTKRRTDCG